MGTKRKRGSPLVTADDLLKSQETLYSSKMKDRNGTNPQWKAAKRISGSVSGDDTGTESEEDSSSKEDNEEAETSPSSSDEQEDAGNSTLSSESLSRISRLSSKLSKPPTSSAHIQSPPKPPSASPRTFQSLGITSTLISALNSMSIKSPTEIQVACIPSLLSGRDCIGNAETGSGKTVAFALPILQALSRDPYGIYALVLTPTRYAVFSSRIDKAHASQRTSIPNIRPVHGSWPSTQCANRDGCRGDGRDHPGSRAEREATCCGRHSRKTG
jgi:ATP-dependent RNA helicase DDX49/DBP8